MTAPPAIRDLRPEEAAALGQLMVGVYSQPEGFPTPAEQPHYYALLADIGRFAERPAARVLVALTEGGALAGGVVYFGDMAQYGSGGTATAERNATGIRLLGVDPACRGRGVGRALTLACMDLAREQGHAQVILHTTEAMRIAGASTSAWASSAPRTWTSPSRACRSSASATASSRRELPSAGDERR